MKTALVQTIEQGGNTYGQVSSPDDLMKAQDFAHEHVNGLTHDFINRSSRPEIVGFDYSLGAGNAFNITVAAPGRIYTQDGISYDLADDTTVTFDTAHATLPRIDLVVATIEDEADSELDLIPFVRLRTTEEFEAEAPAYSPSNISAATELHWKATVSIKKGTPSANPVAPTLDSNEIPLYRVAIGATMIRINELNVTDLRGVVDTVRHLTDQFSQNQIDMSEVRRRLAIVEDLGGRPIDLSQVFGDIQSLEEILADLLSRATSAADLPEIRYEVPKHPLTDNRSSQIIATGNVVSGTPVVDIEIGGRVNFGDAEVVISPNGFVDPDLNARFATIGSDPGHAVRTEALTLASVTPGASDGTVDFVGKSGDLTPARYYPGTAARDEQFVEIFAGVALDNASALSDWKTYDTYNDTITSRVLTGDALPPSDRPALFPFGDGENVLVVAGSMATNTPRSFKVNADTAVSTEITGTKPTGYSFLGDLIGDGRILIIGLQSNGSILHWEYDTGGNTFTALSVTGSVPTFSENAAGGCYYKEDQFLLLSASNLNTGTGKTHIFDRTTLQWTELSINFPYDYFGANMPVVGFRVANVSGRPMLIGGFISQAGRFGPTKSSAYELVNAVVSGAGRSGDGSFVSTQPTWKETVINVPDRSVHGFCSTIGQDAFPSGKGYVFGGQGQYVDPQTQTFGSSQTGLIATSYNGQPGISIGDGSTYAMFEIDPFTAAWDVLAYRASLIGRFTSQNVKLEVSLDDGEHWHTVSPDATFPVTDSAAPGERRLRFTLYRSGSNPPILTSLTEAFDQDGVSEAESRMVVRYDAPDSVKALYIDRLGRVTLSSTIEPSTPQKAIIHKTTPDGSDEPILKNYINRRRPHLKYEGTQPASDAEFGGFDNEMAVPTRYCAGWAYENDSIILGDLKLYYFYANVTFDENVQISGILSVRPSDKWIVELSG